MVSELLPLSCFVHGFWIVSPVMFCPRSALWYWLCSFRLHFPSTGKWSSSRRCRVSGGKLHGMTSCYNQHLEVCPVVDSCLLRCVVCFTLSTCKGCACEWCVSACNNADSFLFLMYCHARMSYHVTSTWLHYTDAKLLCKPLNRTPEMPLKVLTGFKLDLNYYYPLLNSVDLSEKDNCNLHWSLIGQIGYAVQSELGSCFAGGKWKIKLLFVERHCLLISRWFF